MYENLPQELKEYPYFCGWKYETVKGNRTKVPKSIKGHNADIKNLKEFCTLNEAVVHIDEFDGIGIALAGGLSAIDIDHCIKDGKLSEMEEEIVSLAGNYTEISPSGEGIRIICKADGGAYDKDTYYIHNQNLGLEVYGGRDEGYVNLTGNSIADKPVRDITDVLPELLDKYMRRPVPTIRESSVDAPGSYLTYEEVIDKALKSANGDRFLALYEGDITD